LLDEPTADLDADNADAIRALLTNVARTRAVIAATHDAALLAHARSVLEIPV
jgi:ABC-type transport system involved in cytochrome bd biosynthesis fused ATPase/permease subunit